MSLNSVVKIINLISKSITGTISFKENSDEYCSRPIPDFLRNLYLAYVSSLEYCMVCEQKEKNIIKKEEVE